MLLKITVAQKTLQLITLCVQDTQSLVGNIMLLEASVYTYGTVPTAVLSKTYVGVHQLKYEPTLAWEKYDGNDAFLSAEGARYYYLPKCYEDTTKLCFNCPEDGDLHVPSQLTCQPFLFMGGSTRIDIIAHMLMGCMLVLPESNTFYFTTKTASS